MSAQSESGRQVDLHGRRQAQDQINRHQHQFDFSRRHDGVVQQRFTDRNVPIVGHQRQHTKHTAGVHVGEKHLSQTAWNRRLLTLGQQVFDNVGTNR